MDYLPKYRNYKNKYNHLKEYQEINQREKQLESINKDIQKAQKQKNRSKIVELMGTTHPTYSRLGPPYQRGCRSVPSIRPTSICTCPC